MNHNEVRAVAAKHNLGDVYFQFNTSRNTGAHFEVGYVMVDGRKELFCKRQPTSTPEQFHLCNEFANLEAQAPTEVDPRDQKLEEIAREMLDVPTLTLSNVFAEARVQVVNLKQALQLAYKAGQDSRK